MVEICTKFLNCCFAVKKLEVFEEEFSWQTRCYSPHSKVDPKSLNIVWVWWNITASKSRLRTGFWGAVQPCSKETQLWLKWKVTWASIRLQLRTKFSTQCSFGTSQHCFALPQFLFLNGGLNFVFRVADAVEVPCVWSPLCLTLIRDSRSDNCSCVYICGWVCGYGILFIILGTSRIRWMTHVWPGSSTCMKAHRNWWP